jgi:SAM-dependent methyltransferase
MSNETAASSTPELTVVAPTPLRLDLGCGKAKKEGFTGVDCREFPGVDVVCDLGKAQWPWDDDSVDEIHCSHLVEHLNSAERIHFVNEAHRVMKKGAKALIITPHWCSTRAYGDLTHQWPPVSEFWFFYLQKAWRAVNAPHNDAYTCDFDATWGYGLNPKLTVRAQEAQQFAIEFYKEACMDTVATLVKR